MMQSSDSKLFLEKFGRKVASIRKEKGLSQRELCLKLFWDKPNLSSIESGKRNLSTVSLKKLADALDVSVKTLFDFD